MENTVFDFTKYKICSKCKTVKLYAQFGKRTSSKDGHRCTCKACDTADQKQWYQNSGKDYYKNQKKQLTADTV